MRVRVLKRFVNEFGSYRTGTVINFGQSTAQRMIDEGKAEKFTGKYQPELRRQDKLRIRLGDI